MAKKKTKNNRCREQIIHTILTKLVRSPLGMTTKYKLTDVIYQNRKSLSIGYLVGMAEAGIIRLANDDERHRYARYSVQHNLTDGNIPNNIVKGFGLKQRIKQYLSRLNNLYVITDKGRQLLNILEKMQRLIVV
jgi:hypothetical protein